MTAPTPFFPPYTDELHESYFNDFVTFAESPHGFYPGRVMRGNMLVDSKTKPIVFHPQQARVWRELFRRDDTGKFVYSMGVYSDIGKSGKTTFEAAASDWFARVVEPGWEVKIAANKKKQSEMRVFGDLKKSLERLQKVSEQHTATIKAGIIEYDNGSTAEAIPVSAGGEAGGHNSLVGWDELWACDTEPSKRFYAELKPDPTLANTFTLIVSYAPYEGADTPLNGIYNDFFDEAGLMMPGVEKIPGLEDLPCYRKGRIFVYWNHDPYLPWHTPEFLEAEYMRLKQAGLSVDFERIWRNRVTAPEDKFIDYKAVYLCRDENLHTIAEDLELYDWFGSRTLVLGVDASELLDHSGLLAGTWNTAEEHIEVLHVREWKPEMVGGQMRIDLVDLRDEILRLHREHQILACVYDPTQMALMALELEREGVRMVRMTQGGKRIAADMALHQHITNRRIRFPESISPLFTHLRHARRKTGSDGFRIWKKPGSKKKIDLAVALSMMAAGVMENKYRFPRPGKRKANQAVVSVRPDWDALANRSVW